MARLPARLTPARIFVPSLSTASSGLIQRELSVADFHARVISGAIDLLLLQALHVGDERIDVVLRQRRVRFHEWLSFGVRLLAHLLGMDQPLANVGSRELFCGVLERAFGVAFSGDGMAE